MKLVFNLYSTNISKVTCILVLFISMFAMSCKLADKVFPQVTPEEESEVKKICDNIKPPPSFVKTKEEETVKPNLAVRSVRYYSPNPPDGIDKYFVDQLVGSGWEHQKDMRNSPNQFMFKKGKFSIEVVIQSPNHISSEGNIGVACSIGIF